MTTRDEVQLLRDNKNVKGLIAVIGDREETFPVRESALRALDAIHDMRAIDSIVSILLSVLDDFQVRIIAAEVLGNFGGKNVVSPLCRAIQDQDILVSEAADKALRGIKNPDATSTLRIELSNLNLNVVQAVCVALGFLGDHESIKPLLRILMGDVANLSFVAAEALGRIGAVDDLISVIGDKRDYVRTHVAYGLGEARNARGVEPLIKLLKDTNQAVAHSSAISLGMIGDHKAIPFLIAALGDRWTRWGAMEALGLMGCKEAVDPIITILVDTSEISDFRNENQKIAATALGRIRDIRAVEPLITVLRDGESMSAWPDVAEALGQIGDPRALRPLITALGSYHLLTDAMKIVAALKVIVRTSDTLTDQDLKFGVETLEPCKTLEPKIILRLFRVKIASGKWPDF